VTPRLPEEMEKKTEKRRKKVLGDLNEPTHLFLLEREAGGRQRGTVLGCSKENNNPEKGTTVLDYRVDSEPEKVTTSGTCHSHRVQEKREKSER